jgi:5-carboxymethyl-2-hydroxymuconate isomerase
MPHFIIECSNDIWDGCSEEQLLEQVYAVAKDSNLFNANAIKVRIQPFLNFTVGNKREAFINVYTTIMQGRTTEQQALLSKAVVTKLVAMFPEVKHIAMNIVEFEKATYYNRSML